MFSFLRPIHPVHWLCCAWACGLGVAGCARGPQSAPAQALYTDLYKAVQLSEDAGWVVDSVQLEENLESALSSVCQTTPQTREELDQFLERRIAELGGPAAEQYARNGGDLGAVDEV